MGARSLISLRPRNRELLYLLPVGVLTGTGFASVYIARQSFASWGSVGYALFFPTFSTFLGRPGIWLEDVFVRPARRGAGVGRALLAHLAADARQHGATVLQGWFLPTKKNVPAQEFYREHGFEIAGRQNDGVLWRLDLTRNTIVPPEWVQLRYH